MDEAYRRTVLVTGAGRGIGRAEAIYLAAEGANVVVNDPGVGTDGSGGDASVARSVVDEIVAAGGRAVADTGSVADWEDARRMVATAVDAFGDLHAVVNNAAVEISRGLEHLSERDVAAVVDVKLKGTLGVSHWAAVHWRERAAAGFRADRAIVNTASGSGLANPLPLQSNYAAANAGVAALTAVHAVELARLGVRVNCISPSMVRTRLTLPVPGMDQVPDGGRFDPRDPGVVAPLVAYLLSPGCPLTGQVLSVRGGSITVDRGWSHGTGVERDGPWTVPELADRLGALDVEDPFDRLAAALGGALGAGGRDELVAMVNSRLEAAG